MTRRVGTARRRERARGKLLEVGSTAIVVGVLLTWVLPTFMRGPFGASLGPALRPLGWTALAAGTLFLGLHFLIARAAAPRATDRGDQGTSTAEPIRPQVVARAAAARREPQREPRREPRLEPGPISVEESMASRHPPHLGPWSPAVLAAIEWRRFEAVCEALYAQAGFTTHSQPHGADGGVDIWLHSRHSDQPRIVQCKHWQNRPVGVKEMREFLGVMASHGLKSGTYVTSSTFSADAIAFAKANRIHVQDGEALLKLIGQRTPEQQAALLEVACEGEYWRPTCASCGTKMVERHSAKHDGSFWGCANYPRCRGRTIPKARA